MDYDDVKEHATPTNRISTQQDALTATSPAVTPRPTPRTPKPPTPTNLVDAPPVERRGIGCETAQQQRHPATGLGNTSRDDSRRTPHQRR
jgi:hypothetical protein